MGNEADGAPAGRTKEPAPSPADGHRSVPLGPHSFHRRARNPRRDPRGVRMMERIIPVPENRSIM
ncbi:hypothetical protein GCM10010398_00990 [Streptomyces fimbriatus]